MLPRFMRPLRVSPHMRGRVWLAEPPGFFVAVVSFPAVYIIMDYLTLHPSVTISYGLIFN